jgi:hypothetical protein
MKENYKLLSCKSGFSVSVQASRTNYCTPRNDVGPYTLVELGFPTSIEPLIIGFAEDADNPTETVYGYVPVGLVQALIIKHNGIEDGEHPEFDMDPHQSAILAEALLEVDVNCKLNLSIYNT